MFTRKKCDDAFDRDEKAFRKAAQDLLKSSASCVRQAGVDLARACRLFRDQDIAQLGTLLTENLQIDGNFDNIRAACRLFTSGRRKNIRPDPTPEDLVTVSALNLHNATEHLLAEGFTDLPSVGPATVRSRHASGRVLSILRHS